MSDPRRVPSPDQLAEVYRALLPFMARHRTRIDRAAANDEAWFEVYAPLADALAPVRPLVGCFEGWHPRTEESIRAVIEHFDGFTQALGWGELTGPGRDAFVVARRQWYRDKVARPFYEDAVSLWASLDCPDWVEPYANKGRELGFEARSSPEAARARLEERTHSEWISTPLFSHRTPALDTLSERDDERMGKVIVCLREELARVNFVNPGSLLPGATPTDQSRPAAARPPEEEMFAVSGGALAKELDLSHPSNEAMLRQATDLKLISHHEYRGGILYVAPTEKGRPAVERAAARFGKRRRRSKGTS